MHTLGLNVLIIAKVLILISLWLLLPLMIHCCLNYILILSYRNRISFCGIICSSLFPQKESCFFSSSICCLRLFALLRFTSWLSQQTLGKRHDKSWQTSAFHWAVRDLKEKTKIYIYIFFYLFCFPSSGIYLGGKQTCKQTVFLQKNKLIKKKKEKCSIWVLK